MQVKSIAVPYAFKTFVLFIFEWPLKPGFTVHCKYVFARLIRAVIGQHSRAIHKVQACSQGHNHYKLKHNYIA